MVTENQRIFAPQEWTPLGPDSWELDALDPRTLDQIVSAGICRHLPDDWSDRCARVEADRERIRGSAAMTYQIQDGPE